MHQSQRQAALAVARVLDGATLTAGLAAAGAGEAGPGRALVHELAYGTLRHYGTLAALVRVLSAKPIADRVLAALVAVALYQLLHTRAPAFAVVDRAVQASATIARPAAKALVNALLRRFLRERGALVEKVRRDGVARWNHPRWWIARVKTDFPDDWEAILAAGNERPPLALRVNRRQTTRDALLAQFAAHEIGATAAGASGVIVEKPRPVTALAGFSEGHFSVQDLGAQLAAPLLDPGDGMRVLDACAAPGGKAAHLLELADIELTALDSDVERLTRVRENLDRLQLSDPRVAVIEGDARTPERWWDGRPYDRILADVPCTASGVVRRHPDGKWLRRPTDVAAFAALQGAMVDALWSCLASGGKLLYATCSVFRAENEAVASDFLTRHPDALRETLTFGAEVAHRGGQLLPSARGGSHNQDGFFYALLCKA